MSATAPRRTGVVMVTGAYLPEISGGGLQARTMMHALRDHFDFRVLTTCTDSRLPHESAVDGIPVTRVLVDSARPHTKVRALLQTLVFVLKHRRAIDIVHLHGVSQKNVWLTLLAGALGMKIVTTLHTAGQDEPAGIRSQGWLVFNSFLQSDRVIAVSEHLASAYRTAKLPGSRLRLAPNGVDTARFQPIAADLKPALKQDIGGLPADLPWILFVGFFSPDKAPDVAFDAWARMQEAGGPRCALLFAGATASPYHEVDARIADDIRARAGRRGLLDRVHFAGEVRDIERYYQAADLFVMPSTREAFGMALVEAMASGLPVIATRLAGVTDAIVDDGVTGRLVAGRNAEELCTAMTELLANPARAARMGEAGRMAVEARFGLAASASRWRAIYDELVTA